MKNKLVVDFKNYLNAGRLNGLYDTKELQLHSLERFMWGMGYMAEDEYKGFTKVSNHPYKEVPYNLLNIKFSEAVQFHNTGFLAKVCRSVLEGKFTKVVYVKDFEDQLAKANDLKLVEQVKLQRLKGGTIKVQNYFIKCCVTYEVK